MSLILLQRYVLNWHKYKYRIKFYQYVSSEGFGMLSFWQDWWIKNIRQWGCRIFWWANCIWKGLLLLLSDCKLNKVIGWFSVPATSCFPTHNRLSEVRACDMPAPSLRLRFSVQVPFQPLERWNLVRHGLVKSSLLSDCKLGSADRCVPSLLLWCRRHFPGWGALMAFRSA